MQEGLAPEHSGKLLADTLEQLLDGRAVADESGGHLQATRWDVANGSLHVVWDPLHKVRAVLVLHVEHLLVNLLHGHASTEYGSHSQVAAVTRVTCSHHVLGVEHLLSQLGDGQGSVLLGATAGERGESWHEEVKTGEGDHVDSQFAQICVQLTGESEASGDTAHGSRNKVVEISVCGGGELEGTETDVVKGFIVDTVGLVCVLDKLVNRQGCVVRLDYSVRHLGRWHHAESVHDPVRVLLTDL